MSFVIGTLTFNDRSVLFETINKLHPFLMDGVDWIIFAQGCTSKYLEQLNELTSNLSNINFHVISQPNNLGLSKGFNRLFMYLKPYEFTLLLEDDWICVADLVTESNWLDGALDFMYNNPHVSTIFLRKYLDKEEKHQFGWSRSIPYMCFNNSNNFNYAQKLGPIIESKYQVQLREIKDCLFTLNPTIHRTIDYWKCGVIPLQEYNDVNPSRDNCVTTTYEDDIANWGWAEALAMEQTRHLTTFNLNHGIFAHYDHLLKFQQRGSPCN